MWEQFNRLFHEVRRMESAGLWSSQPLDFLAVILESSHLVQGVTDSTMNHGEGWQFIQVGRFIERAAAISRLLDTYFHEFPRRTADGLGRAHGMDRPATELHRV